MSQFDIQKQFGENASKYVTSPWHAKGPDLLKLVEIAKLQGSEKVLDVATGGGHVSNALASLTKEVVAYDLTMEIIEVAKRFLGGNGHRNVKFVQGDAEQMPFADEEFDVISCRIAAHHFPNVQKFISESYRTLRKGGQFLFIDNVAPEKQKLDDFYNNVEKRRDYSHHRAWKKSEWISFIEKSGFEIEQWHRFSKTFIFDEWCARLKLADDEKKRLAEDMINASKECHVKFRVNIQNGKLYSFQGESILLKAIKPL